MSCDVINMTVIKSINVQVCVSNQYIQQVDHCKISSFNDLSMNVILHLTIKVTVAKSLRYFQFMFTINHKQSVL